MEQINIDFETVRYFNKATHSAAELPAEDFEDGKCTLLVRQLLRNFRSEEDDRVAGELKQATEREREKFETMTRVAATEEDRLKNAMRQAYAMHCLSQMNL